MIKVKVTDKLFKEAKARNDFFYKKMGKVGTHRKNKPKQRMTGYLAEFAVKKTFPDLKFSKDPVVDFLFDKGSIDVKAQGAIREPRPSDVATIYQEQRKRHTDYYVFCRTMKDFSFVYINGIISKSEFYEKAVLREAGYQGPYFVYDEPRYEIQLKDLYDLEDVLEDW